MGSSSKSMKEAHKTVEAGARSVAGKALPAPTTMEGITQVRLAHSLSGVSECAWFHRPAGSID
jgi:hypothetical protein